MLEEAKILRVYLILVAILAFIFYAGLPLLKYFFGPK